jgi:DNA-binding CsgD family transcriptional regulator
VNVESYSARAWYGLSGAEQILGFAVLIAAIHFFTGVYQVHGRSTITITFLVLMFVCSVLLFSPGGARFEADTGTIHFGIAYKIVALSYFATFTCMLALGYGLLRRAWQTKRRSFLIGLLLFATIGYFETAINLLNALRETSARLSNEGGFLVSSIPYALYGAFLIAYFLQHPAPPPLNMDALPESFLTEYNITDREREIILKVVQGKSNADIAGELFISLATVKTHLHNIYRKLDVDSRYDLLARIRAGQ